MKLYKIILVSIVVIVLSSCGSTNDSGVQFTIPMSEIGADVQENKYLQIIAPEGWNSFKTGESISLMVRNISENQIAFAPDFGAKMFIRTDKEWVEVENKITYKNDPSTLDPSDDWFVDKTVSPIVRPILSNDSVPYDIRVFIIGDLMENGKASKKVGSYIDLKLNP